jgi:putative methionine-R-sulfoxide reductase with GAF domain
MEENGTMTVLNQAARSLLSIEEPVAPRLHHRRMVRWLFPSVSALLILLLPSYAAFLQLAPRSWLLLWWAGTTFLLVLRTTLALPFSALRLFRFQRDLRRSNTRRRRVKAFQDVVATRRRKARLGFENHLWVWVFDFAQLLALWGFIFLIANRSEPSQELYRLTLVLLVQFASLIPFGMLLQEAMEQIGWGQRSYFCFLLVATGVLVSGAGLFLLTRDPAITLAGAIVSGCIYLTIYASLRLSIGSEVASRTIQHLSSEILAYPDVSHFYQYIPDLICHKFRYEKVFFLEPGPNNRELVIKGQSGNYPDVRGRNFPISMGITGKAFRRRKPQAWNDVGECPFYHSLVDDDDTRAEIAVPVEHKGEVFGVLDIQSERPGVYGPGDIDVLETLGKVLGAAIAASKVEQMLGESIRIDQELRDSWLDREASVFESFATFARESLGGDLVIYYPLSSTGFPSRKPYIDGEFKNVKAMHSPVTDMESPLIRLIRDWKPVFEEKSDPRSGLFNPSLPDNFVKREQVVSTCFLPIGSARDPLGALFINYRSQAHFNVAKQATILSFARAFSTVAARVRYQEFFYRSYGRPELSVHNIKNRHLHRGKVALAGRTATLSCLSCEFKDRLTPVYQMLDRVDMFIDEVTLSQATIPPNFAKTTFTQVLSDVISTLPPRSDSRRPVVPLDNIDSRIERESIWFKMALYRLITEALNNAVIHGNAARIDVTLQRKPDRTELEILNDGAPFDTKSRAWSSQRGIYFLLDEFDSSFGADKDIGPGPDGKGTRIWVSIPCLPI